MAKVQLNVRVDKRLTDQLRTVAEIEKVNLGEIVEEAGRMLLAERRADPEWQARFEDWAEYQRSLLSSFDNGEGS